MRFWAPGSPPQAFCLARFDARRAWGPAVCRSGRRGGAWWLENWIVDASKTRVFESLFCC